MTFKDKSVFITGGASGIGGALTSFFITEGAKVNFLDLDKDVGNALCKKLNSDNCNFYIGDVTDEARMQSVLAETIRKNGLDIVINNAGYEGNLTYLAQDDSETFKRVLDINVLGVFYGIKYSIPYFMSQRAGIIINLGSIAGLHASPLMGAYGASKHAVVGMTKTTAQEYGKYGIRINAICPTVVNGTAMSSADNALTKEMLEDLTSKNPMRKLGEIEDVVALTAYLASNKSGFMNGQCLKLDGGQYN